MIDITQHDFLSDAWAARIEMSGWCPNPDFDWQPEPENRPPPEDRIKFGFDLSPRGKE
jgi:hypothetical protein